MRCAACALRLERTLSQHRGVRHAVVSFAGESATVHWDPGVVRLDAMVAAAAASGFELAPHRERDALGAEQDAREVRDTAVRLAIGAFFSMSAMVPALAVYAGIMDGMAPATAWHLALASGVLAIPVLFYSGTPFFAGAWRGLKHGALGMDFLVAAGAGLAFGYSTWQLARGSSEVYFDSASMIVTLLLVGRLIERRARKRGGDAVRQLLSAAPELARVVEQDGTERERAAASVATGQVIRLRPGERSPLDGVILAGQSFLDRSILTGESSPVPVCAGDRVEAGALNCEGALTLRVTAAAGERAIDGVARAVDHLLSERSPIMALSDRVVGIFAPAVSVIAAVVGVTYGWSGGGTGGGILRAVSVLVIACPCALGLATPMALLVAAGRAARQGIVFRDGEAIERAARVDAVLFDKTGTLTEGRPRVAAVHPVPGVPSEEVLRCAARAEAQSEHPIARAIVAAAPELPASQDGVLVAQVGRGVCWSVRGEETLVGSPALLREKKVEIAGRGAFEGTSVEVARAGRWLGTIVVSDSLRSTSPGAVAALRHLGIRVLGILSGDAERPVREVGRRLGLEDRDVAFECTPERKAEHIQALRRAGHRVAFVGDGLNDAVALCAADLAVAATGATDLAMQIAQVALREGGIARLATAIALARRTRRIMRSNIAWAIGYNLVAIPVAIAGLAPPVAAAVAMALSSITVVANSLRLATDERLQRQAPREPAQCLP
jgi:heavy metal translocating P-type ATPase